MAELLERRPVREDADLARAREELRQAEELWGRYGSDVVVRFRNGRVSVERPALAPPVPRRGRTLDELCLQQDRAMGRPPGETRRSRAAADPVPARAAPTPARPVLSGRAIVVNSLSENLGGFRERILPGASTGRCARTSTSWPWLTPLRPLSRRALDRPAGTERAFRRVRHATDGRERAVDLQGP